MVIEKDGGRVTRKARNGKEGRKDTEPPVSVFKILLPDLLL